MFRFIFLATLLLDAAGSEAGGAGAGASGGASGGSGTGTGSSSSSAGTSGGGSGTGSNGQNAPSGTNDGQGQGQNNGQGAGTQDPNASDPAYGNWKLMRESLQNERTTRAGLETQLQTYNTVKTAQQTLATQLGFTKEDFDAAWKADPIKTAMAIAEAQAEAQRTGQSGRGDDKPDLDKMVRDAVSKATKPANDFVNTQMAEAAMTKYNTTVTEAITADPIFKAAPPEVHQLAKDYLEEYFAGQPDILLAMKTKGDFSSVKEAVSYISGRLHTAFQSWLKHSNSTGGFGGDRQGQGNGGQGMGNGQGKRPSLDDIINDPSVLGSQYK